MICYSIKIDLLLCLWLSEKQSFDLSQSKSFILPEEDNNLFNAKFQINKTKLCFPIAVIFMNKNIIFLKNAKQEFKRRLSQNKYKSRITIRLKVKNLDYMIDPIFSNDHMLFVLSVKNRAIDPTRDPFVSIIFHQ